MPLRMQPAAHAPILLFDSGFGGLSVLAALRRALPDAPVVYAADLAALPYGEKDEEEIAARVPAILGRMVERFAPRLVTIACNTASTIALDAVRAALDVPVVGTVPAIKPAAETTRTGAIGLLGTRATVRQVYVDRLEAEFANGVCLLRHAAPDLVPAAETKLRGGRTDPGVFARAVAGLEAQAGGHRIDTVVLACTHFPLVEEELAAAFGRPVSFVHGGDGIARRIAHLTHGQSFERSRPDRAVVTGDIGDSSVLFSALAAYGLDTIETF